MISLAMIVRNDAEMLRRTLPVVAPIFREKIALVFEGEDDSWEVLRGFGFRLYSAEWPGDYSVARNTLHALTRRNLTEPWSLQLDADEAIWPEEAEVLRREVRNTLADALALPRYNLSTPSGVELETAIREDSLLWESHSYPDFQARLLRVASPLEYRLRVHEVLFRVGGSKTLSQLGELGESSVHLYHYSGCRSLEHLWLKHHNYQLLARGESLLESCPLTREQLVAQTDRSRLPKFNQLQPLHA